MRPSTSACGALGAVGLVGQRLPSDSWRSTNSPTSLAKLLIGPPSRRYQHVCFEIPAEGDLRREVPLLDGWRGGGLSREALASLYPYPPAQPFTRYRAFDPHEARVVWWAWRVEDGEPPHFPDFVELHTNPNGPWQVTVSEQLITMLHAVAHPGRVVPLARIVAYEGQGIQTIAGAMNPTPEHWDPEYMVDPLEDDDDFIQEAFWEAHQSDPLLYDGGGRLPGPNRVACSGPPRARRAVRVTPIRLALQSRPPSTGASARCSKRPYTG